MKGCAAAPNRAPKPATGKIRLQMAAAVKTGPDVARDVLEPRLTLD